MLSLKEGSGSGQSGDTAMIQSPPTGTDQTILLTGNSLVMDGIKSAGRMARTLADMSVSVTGNYNAMFNAEVDPDIVPVTSYGVMDNGGHNLLYGSYLHDFGSPEATQNPDGNGGWVLAVYGAGAQTT